MKLKQRMVIVLVCLCILISVNILIKHSKSKYYSDILQERNPDFVNFEKIEEDKNFEKANVILQSKNDYLISELGRLQLDFRYALIDNIQKPFEIAAKWVGERQIYPRIHPEMAAILKVMSTAKIIHADVLPKGTQIKLLLALEGGQQVVFKQKRYERDFVIEGKPYDGYDRHNAEIAAFHLDRILDFRRSPLVVGRIINLKEEVMPVATERLLNTFRERNGSTCYFGICHFCKEKEMACADGDIMEGAVTLWLPEDWATFEKQRHPYQRTYVDGREARWEREENYCNAVVKKTAPYDRGTRLLDITDATVFDYLIGNADRHHYETFKGHGPDVMILLMDNAKSFGNPFHHEQSILAPLKQCCILRNSTWQKLKHLENGILPKLLEEVMANDPIAPILHPFHLNAVDVRLPVLLETVDTCIKKYGIRHVIVTKWNGSN